jgi:anti-sigma-K factor RskA
MSEREPIGVDERALDDAALEALAEAHAVEPPRALRAGLLAAARAEARAGLLARSRRRWRAVGSMAAVLVLALTGLLGRQTQQTTARSVQLAALAADYDALERGLAAQDRRLVSLQETLDTQTHVLRVLDGPQLRSASLAPTEGRGGRARVLLDAASGEAAVMLSGVAPLEAGKIYELWAIRGARAPEPAGLLAVAAGTPTVLRVAPIPAPGEVSAFAISIEPAGGSPSPTGPVVLGGAVG